jgi:hypothetical protein
MDEALQHPVGFGRAILGLSYYDWQEKVLDSIYRNRRTSLVTGNGCGKTDRILATSVLWFLSIFPKSLVVLTSASWDQVLHQVWPALRRHEDRFGGLWDINKTEITAPNAAMCIGRSVKEPGKFEGHHGNPDRPLMIVADEAKSIPDEIFGAINRCTYQRLLLASSAGIEEGYFYESQTSKSSMFSTFRATKHDCPHIPKEDIEEIIQSNGGVDDPYVQSVVFANFMKDSGAADWYKPVKLTDYERCIKDPPRKKLGERFAYCDFAAGGDENVIAIAEGNEILPLIYWKDKDTVRAASDFVEKLRSHNIPESHCYGDEDGTGHGVMDNMARIGYNVNRVRNGSASRHDKYFNAGSEAWFELGNTIRRKEVILPHDQILREQLVSRKGDRKGGEGKYYIQPKRELQKSPDRGDAVAGVMYWKGHGQVHLMQVDRKFLFQEEENEQKDLNTEELIAQGIYAG